MARAERLPNGLTLLLERLPYAPVAAVVLAYRTGSRNETEGTRGLSHFCEHMVFKGTPSIPRSRLWQIVERDGGIANAFTTRDMTAYFSMLPASRLEDALRIESDRMVNCILDP
ncbi:insulinase family protein, partial [Candidatus Fermentibacterales bacterium]|nr:insulinase family protein [Candidatus Fermentibacterales bacterium]